MIPQEIYLSLFEADFLSRVYYEDPYIIINLAQRKGKKDVLFTIYLLTLAKPQQQHENVYSCNLFRNSNDQYYIKAQQAVKYVVYQKFGFKEQIKSDDDEIKQIWIQKLKEANKKVLTYVNLKRTKKVD